MKRILLIFGGGTIVSSFHRRATGPDVNASKSLHDYVEKFFKDKDIKLVCYDPWGIPGKDSSNLNPSNWLEITSIIVEELQKGLSGVLILYGTDTMAYLSSWLSLCFPKVSIPIILTGSQLTLDYIPEDVTVNLRGAAQVVCSNISGVWIYCNWKLIPGARAHKAHALHPDVFVTVNGIPVYFNPDWALGEKSRIKSEKDKDFEPSLWLNKVLSFNKDEARGIYDKIIWIMCVPGMKLRLNYDQDKILCIYGYGAGNAPTEVLNYIRTFYIDKPKPCVIACSQAEGDIKKPDYYKEVGIALLTKDKFRVWSQMDYPIEFIHTLACFSLLASFDDPGLILSQYLNGIN